MSEKRASPSARQNTNERDRIISPEDRTHEQQATEPPPKKRGRKKGSKVELNALQTSGGYGGRARKSIFSEAGRKEESSWNLDGGHCREILSDDSSYSSSDDSSCLSESEEEEEFDAEIGDHELDECISDLEGNRILPVKKVVEVLRTSVTCKRCVLRNHKKITKNFLAFCSQYEEDIEHKEATKLFRSRTDRLEWRLGKQKKVAELYQIFLGSQASKYGSLENQLCNNFRVGEETYGVATSLFGFCSRARKPHIFRIEADKISAEIRKTFHGNAKGKQYAANYQMAAAMQQMGVGVTDVQTLCGFMDLPTSASCQHHIRQAEAVAGPIQIDLQKKSEEEARLEEKLRK